MTLSIRHWDSKCHHISAIKTVRPLSQTQHVSEDMVLLFDEASGTLSTVRCYLDQGVSRFPSSWLHLTGFLDQVERWNLCSLVSLRVRGFRSESFSWSILWSSRSALGLFLPGNMILAQLMINHVFPSVFLCVIPGVAVWGQCGSPALCPYRPYRACPQALH